LDVCEDNVELPLGERKVARAQRADDFVAAHGGAEVLRYRDSCEPSLTASFEVAHAKKRYTLTGTRATLEVLENRGYSDLVSNL
jgi:hypothetical protein